MIKDQAEQKAMFSLLQLQTDRVVIYAENPQKMHKMIDVTAFLRTE